MLSGVYTGTTDATRLEITIVDTSTTALNLETVLGASTVLAKAIVHGGNANDTITGGSSADTITGGSGDDVISGTAGADNIDGGTGNDSITLGAGSHTVDGGIGTDTLTVTTTATDTEWNSITNVETIHIATDVATTIAAVNGLVASGATLYVDASALITTNILTFDGSGEQDGKFSIVGGAASDIITGGTGADTISGGGGSDSIAGGNGADSILGGAGSDQITGGAGADTMDGGADNESFIILNADTASVKGTGTASASNLVFGTALNAAQSFSTTGLDIINSFAAGDTINLYSTDTTGVAFNATIVTNAGTFTDATGQLGLIKGAYSSSLGTFTASATGTDTALIYDTDGTSASGALNAIILVGYVGAGGADTIDTTSGLFTAVA